MDSIYINIHNMVGVILLTLIGKNIMLSEKFKKMEKEFERLVVYTILNRFQKEQFWADSHIHSPDSNLYQILLSEEERSNSIKATSKMEKALFAIFRHEAIDRTRINGMLGSPCVYTVKNIEALAAAYNFNLSNLKKEEDMTKDTVNINLVKFKSNNSIKIRSRNYKLDFILFSILSNFKTTAIFDISHIYQILTDEYGFICDKAFKAAVWNSFNYYVKKGLLKFTPRNSNYTKHTYNVIDTTIIKNCVDIHKVKVPDIQAVVKEFNHSKKVKVRRIKKSKPTPYKLVGFPEPLNLNVEQFINLIYTMILNIKPGVLFTMVELLNLFVVDTKRDYKVLHQKVWKRIKYLDTQGILKQTKFAIKTASSYELIDRERLIKLRDEVSPTHSTPKLEVKTNNTTTPSSVKENAGKVATRIISEQTTEFWAQDIYLAVIGKGQYVPLLYIKNWLIELLNNGYIETVSTIDIGHNKYEYYKVVDKTAILSRGEDFNVTDKEKNAYHVSDVFDDIKLLRALNFCSNSINTLSEINEHLIHENDIHIPIEILKKYMNLLLKKGVVATNGDNFYKPGKNKLKFDEKIPASSTNKKIVESTNQQTEETPKMEITETPPEEKITDTQTGKTPKTETISIRFPAFPSINDLETGNIVMDFAVQVHSVYGELHTKYVELLNELEGHRTSAFDSAQKILDLTKEIETITKDKEVLNDSLSQTASALLTAKTTIAQQKQKITSLEESIDRNLSRRTLELKPLG